MRGRSQDISAGRYLEFLMEKLVVQGILNFRIRFSTFLPKRSLNVVSSPPPNAVNPQSLGGDSALLFGISMYLKLNLSGTKLHPFYPSAHSNSDERTHR